MAYHQHTMIIEQGVEPWNAWRSEHPSVLPDLEGANLEGANLEGANLEGANVQKANLCRANLRRANLERANLQKAKLRGANLGAANLEGANLVEALLRGAYLGEANLCRANLEGANLGADFEGADLEGANLQEANLLEARLVRANLEGANLRGANLEGANLEGANLRGAKLEGVPMEGILHIPLRNQVLATDLGHLLNSLADLYSVIQEIDDTRPEELVAKRISVGTPNLVELIGVLPEITATAAALLAVLKVPIAFGEGAKYLAEARKLWIEGTLAKEQHASKLADQYKERIESSFYSLAHARDVVSAEPTLRIEASRSPKPRPAQSRRRSTSGQTRGHP